MPMNFTWQSMSELVSYWDIRAKEYRTKAKKLHPRSHERRALESAASECEWMATMLRGSNLAVVTDYDKAAASGAVA